MLILRVIQYRICFGLKFMKLKTQTCTPFSGLSGRSVRLMWLAMNAGVLLIVGCVEARKPGWLGLNAYLSGSQVGTRASELAGDVIHERDMQTELLAELGVSRVRDAFMNWGHIQREQGGPLDFSLSDDLVRRAQTVPIQLLSVCWGVPRWAAAGSGASVVDFGVPSRRHADAFVDFVDRFVERYDGDGRKDMPGLQQPIRAYEFMNEIELVPTGEYAYWLKLFHHTVKNADAKATVVLGALRSPGLRIGDASGADDPGYFARLLSDRELSGTGWPFFDVVSFHGYPARYPGRRAFDEPLVYLRQSMANHGLDLPVWLTECGADGNRKQEATQAEDLVKWVLRARGLGIERVYWYCLWDRPRLAHPDVQENMGLLSEGVNDRGLHRKLAFQAFGKLLAELENRPTVTRQDEGLYKLTGNMDEPVYVIWRVEGYEPLAVPISDWWEVRTLSGARYKRRGAAIQVMGSPVFLERTRSAFLE